MLNSNILNKALDKVKKVTATEKLDDVKILIDTYDELPTDITLKNFMILITCITKDDGKFRPLLFLKEGLVA